MVGLVFKETLSLSTFQYSCILLNMFLCSLAINIKRSWTAVVIPCYIGILWAAFGGHMISLDVRITWGQLSRLQGLSFSQFLSTLPHCNYVHLQPPWFTWFVVKISSYTWQQIYVLTWMVLCLFLCRVLYGHYHMCLIAATPLFQIISTQPMNVAYAFGCVLIALRLLQLRHNVLSSFIFLIGSVIKYSTIITLPWMVSQNKMTIFMSVLGSIFYWWFARKQYWGTQQFKYLLHQFSFGIWSYHKSKNTTTRLHKFQSILIFRIIRKIIFTIRWRWQHIGKHALFAGGFYLFPVYLVPIKKSWFLLVFGILIGYGNTKYFLLTLPFLFPVQP